MLKFLLVILIQTTCFSQTIFYRNHLTGDWFGARNFLIERGIKPNLSYTADVFSNINGGIKKGETYLSNIDLAFDFDLEKIIGLNGSKVFFYGLGNSGGNPDKKIGDIQGVSNITAPNAWKIYEAWIQTNLFNNHLSLLAGLYNLNSEFDILESSNLFINSSHGIGIAFSQTGKNGPSIFPATSAGLRIGTKFNKSFYFQTCILNGVPADPSIPKFNTLKFNKKNGLLLSFETGFLLYSKDYEDNTDSKFDIGRFSVENYSSKITIGFWKYTGQFNKLNELNNEEKQITSEDNIGAYFIAEKCIYNNPENDIQSLAAFLRFETANSKINRFAYYFGCGLVYDCPLSCRPDDQIGIAFADAVNGSSYKNLLKMNEENVSNSEYNFELTYLAQIFPWFSLQPDIQYIINPDTNPAIANSIAFDLRLNFDI